MEVNIKIAEEGTEISMGVIVPREAVSTETPETPVLLAFAIQELFETGELADRYVDLIEKRVKRLEEEKVCQV